MSLFSILFSLYPNLLVSMKVGMDVSRSASSMFHTPPPWKPPLCPLEQWSPTFLAPDTCFVEDNLSADQGVGAGDNFRMIQVYYIYCALYFYCYYIVIHNEIIIQLTMMQNQWGPWLCFPASRWSHLGGGGRQ